MNHTDSIAADAPPPAGCDTLNISFRGAPKSFSKEMGEVEKRIQQICDERIPKLDPKIKELAKSCAGETFGASGDFDVSMDGHAQNFINRTENICKFLKEAKEKVRPGPDSFCGRFAARANDAAKLFVNSDEQNLLGQKSEILARLNNLKGKHDQVANTFSSISAEAQKYKSIIERGLPKESDPNSPRTEDKGLQHLLKITQNAKTNRIENIKKKYEQIQTTNPPPTNANQEIQKLIKSANDCQQLERGLTQYKDMMENNLLPNGRRMTKLLDEAGRATKEESAKHTQRSATIQQQIARLGSDQSSISGDTAGTQNQPIDLRKDNGDAFKDPPLAAKPETFTERNGEKFTPLKVGNQSVMPTQLASNPRYDPGYTKVASRYMRLNGAGQLIQVEFYRHTGSGQYFFYPIK